MRRDFTLRGAGAAATVIDAAELDVASHVHAGAAVTIERLTLTGCGFSTATLGPEFVLSLLPIPSAISSGRVAGPEEFLHRSKILASVFDWGRKSS